MQSKRPQCYEYATHTHTHTAGILYFNHAKESVGIEIKSEA